MFKHKSLLIFQFFERFSFYIFLSSIILFLNDKLQLNDETTGNIYGIFMAGIYFLPIILGFISDLYGRERFLLMGLLISTIGYLIVSFNSGPISTLAISLSVLVIGLSFIKANITVLFFESILKHKIKILLLLLILFFIASDIVMVPVQVISTVISDSQLYDAAIFFSFLILLLLSIPAIMMYFRTKEKEALVITEKYFDYRYLIIFICLLIVISSGSIVQKGIQDQLNKTFDIDQLYIRYIRIFITIIILSSFFLLKPKDSSKTIFRMILFCLVLFCFSFLLIPFSNRLFEMNKVIILIIYGFFQIPSILFYPLLYFTILKIYGGKYKCTLLSVCFSLTPILNIIKNRLDTYIEDYSKIILFSIGVLLIGLIYMFNKKGEIIYK